MKKKVAILIYSLASGGAERVVSILLKKLKDSYDITLVLMNDTIFYDIPKEIDIYYLDKSSPNESGFKKLSKLPILGLKYKKFLKDNSIDVSLSFMSRPNYINVTAKLLGSGAKTIISERTSPSKEYNSSSSRDTTSKSLIESLYKKADLVVPNSKMISLELNREFEVPKEKLRVIYNPIDLDMINSLKDESINLTKDKFTFITVGRLDAGKNHSLLIDAFYKANLNANLWIIGDGELKKELEDKIKSLKLQDRVKLLGKKFNPYKFLSKTDCFVFSSEYEGFPNAILEALACSLPVISTDCKSGPREILAPKSDFTKEAYEIEKAEFGILTPVGDVDKLSKAMVMIVQDEALREKLSRRGVLRAKDFEANRVIKEWIEVIEE